MSRSQNNPRLTRAGKEFKALIERNGLEVKQVQITGNCHYKFTVCFEYGDRNVIAPFSGSDHRGQKNFEANLRRMKANNG
jgi:hypothetical protein